MSNREGHKVGCNQMNGNCRNGGEPPWLDEIGSAHGVPHDRPFQPDDSLWAQVPPAWRPQAPPEGSGTEMHQPPRPTPPGQWMPQPGNPRPGMAGQPPQVPGRQSDLMRVAKGALAQSGIRIPEQQLAEAMRQAWQWAMKAAPGARNVQPVPNQTRRNP